MNNQVIVPIAVIVLIGIVIAIIFLDGKDKMELEKQLNQHDPKKGLPDTDEGKSKQFSGAGWSSFLSFIPAIACTVLTVMFQIKICLSGLSMVIIQ
jgi:hypothetical protein